MNKYLLKFFKVLKISTIALLLLFFLATILIQTSKVQNWLVDKATVMLSGTLQTKVAIEKVDLEFFKTAVIEGIFIEDQHADTLLYAQKLKANIGIFSLFGKEMFLNTITLEGAVVQLSKLENDSLFNFQFIIDTFSSNEPKAKQKEENSAGWAFGIGKVIIEDTRFRMADENIGGFELKTKVGSLNISADELDFGNNKIALSDLNLSESTVEFTILEGTKTEKDDTSKLVFPSLGWDISADELQLENNQFKLSNLNYERQADRVDYNHLYFTNISLEVNDLNLNDTSMFANIQKASLADHSGLALQNLSAEARLDNQNISAKNLRFKTPNSSLKGDVSLSFNDFADLADFMNKVKLEGTFEPSQVAYRDLTKIIAVLQNIPFMNTNIDEKIDLDGNIILQKNNIYFKEFYSKIGKVFYLRANGSISQLTSDPLFDLDIKKLKTDYNSFMRLTKKVPLPEGLAELGIIDFSGQINGTVSDLKGKNINLITESATSYEGNLNIHGLPDIEKTIFTADAKNLTVDAGDIEAFSNTDFPDILDSLGLIKFKGKFEGTIYKFDVNGIFQTDAGEMQSDLALDFETDYQNATYDGIVKIENFDLSKLLGEPFGSSSFNLKTSGSGLNVNDLDLSASGEIPLFYYKNYTYQNLSLNGAFFKKRFEGIAKAADENLRFDFQGMIDLNDSLPDMQMTLSMDTINLQALNFYEKNLGLSGNIEANLKGNNLDNMIGIATLERFRITQDSIFYSTDKTISLEATVPALNQKAIRFRSDFMNANITGEFIIADFQQSIVEFIDGFFPIEEMVLKDSASQIIEPADEQDIAFDFEFNDLSGIGQLFLPDFAAADTAHLKGSFNSQKKRLKLNGSFPNLVYGDYEIDTIRISTNGTSQQLESIISIEQFQSDGNINFPFITFNTLFADNVMNFGLNILGMEETIKKGFLTDSPTITKIDTSLALKGNISFNNDFYTLSFLPEFILNNYTWGIDASNKIEIAPGELTISHLDFIKDQQKISINSRGTAPIDDFKPIEISISNFDLVELSKMLGMTNSMFGGMVNGDLILKEPKTNLHYNTAILVDSLSYNERLVGNLDIKAKQPSLTEVIDLSVKLEGESQLSVVGNYEIENQLFDLDFQFGKVPIFLIDPFLTGILKQSDGFLTGQMKVKGTASQPDVNGILNLRDFSTTAVISNMQYRAQEATVQVSEDAIDIGTIPLKDTNDNDAVLSGKILHNYFDDIVFDLKFNTESFQFLNTTVAENELYFGNLFLKATLEITGTPELPLINIDATTLPNSEIYVQPFVGEKAVSQEDYIIYANPENYDEDSLLLVEQRIIRNRSSFDLSLKLQVTTDATLNIIITPETGDQLISIGTANLILRIEPSGEMTAAGSYTIDRGSYSLNYEQLVKRDFEINKGSTINFSGDPMDASFDVTATYKVRASTYELLSDQSTLSDAELQASNVRTNVLVLMKLRGNLNDPSISFDIQLPDAQLDGVSSAANRKLAELRQNPEELNKQAFGLLLFKSFIAENSSSQTFSGAGTAMALSSVSNLLTDQLNNFADRYVEGFEVDFGVESYNTSGAESANVTKMQMNVSKHLFHDRLTVKVGTNLNLGAQDAGSIFNSDYSGIAGDFVLEYQLTETGNYLIKVFHMSDYNVLEQNNAYNTGAGIIFRRSFNGKKFKK